MRRVLQLNLKTVYNYIIKNVFQLKINTYGKHDSRRPVLMTKTNVSNVLEINELLINLYLYQLNCFQLIKNYKINQNVNKLL